MIGWGIPEPVVGILLFKEVGMVHRCLSGNLLRLLVCLLFPLCGAAAPAADGFKEKYARMEEAAGKDARKHVAIARFCEEARIMHLANYHYAIARKLSPTSYSIKKEQDRFLGRIVKELYFFGYYDPGVDWVEGQNTLVVCKKAAEKKHFRLIWLERIFYDRSKPTQLRPDWKAKLAEAAKKYKKDIEMGRALGFSIGDELVWKGLPVGELNKVCDAVRRSFPNPRVVLYYNEAWGPIKGIDMKGNKFTYKVPKALTWFSIDLYRPGTTGDHVARMRDIYTRKIYPLLHKDQRVVLVPGCFERKGAGWDKAKARDIRNYCRWAVEDERVVGLFPWGYGGKNGFGGMNEAKKAYEKACSKVAYGEAQQERERLK